MSAVALKSLEKKFQNNINNYNALYFDIEN